MKACSKCKVEKPISEFKKNATRKNGVDSHCLECHRVYGRKSWKSHALSKFYNISVTDFNLLLEKQAHVCAICGEACPSGRSLAVDHCHKTQNVRGLLCMNCNNGLGRFKDDISRLEAAIVYLRGNNEFRRAADLLQR